MAEPKPKPLCVYCGTSEGTTADHVIQRCLFPPPFPKNLITVPACDLCNGEKSGDDEFMRDMLLLDWENEPHPASQGELKHRLIRAIGKNRSHLIREGRRTKRLTPVLTPGGIELGVAPAIPLDRERVNRMFSRIARGLYYHFSGGLRLPADCTFEVNKVHPMRKDQTIQMFNRPGARMHALGDVFECVYIVAKEDPTLSMWLLRLWNVFVVVNTNSDKCRPPLRQMTSWLS